LRVVKKTLKGDLMGRTGFKAVKPGKARKDESPPVPESGAPIPPQPANAGGKETNGAKPAPANPSSPQRSLDDLMGDDIVVITEPLRPREGRPIHIGTPERNGRAPPPAQAAKAQPPVEHKAVAAVAFQPLKDGAALPLARSVLAEGLYKDVGEKGSKMQHPTGITFHLDAKWGDGVVHTQHNVTVPLQNGHAASHLADVVIALDNRALLVLDLVASSVTVLEMKALAFDALQLHQVERCFTVLVYVRTPGAGMPQQQAEALGHGYDVVFGIDEADVHSELKFASLRNRIQTWVAAASGKKR
jgi:hypothetical protein